MSEEKIGGIFMLILALILLGVPILLYLYVVIDECINKKKEIRKHGIFSGQTFFTCEKNPYDRKTIEIDSINEEFLAIKDENFELKIMEVKEFKELLNKKKYI